MKVIAIVLLLINLGLVAWQYQQRVQAQVRHAASHQPPPPPPPSTAASLRLLAELPQLPPLKSPPAGDDSAAVTSEVKDNVAGADLCIDVGPFADAPARDHARDWLREYTAALYLRADSVRMHQFFWIYLEPSSAVSAEQSLTELHNRGVQDTMMIRRGELKNAISLGFFRSQDSVNRRLAELTDKGYQPIVVPKFETTERYWIAARIAEQFTEAPGIPADLIGAAKVKTIACASMHTGASGDDPSAASSDHKPLVEGLTN